MNACQGLRDYFRLAAIDAPGDPLGARVTFAGGTCLIGLTARVRAPRGEMARVRLLQSLALLTACRRAPDGAVWFNLDDAGEVPGLAFCDYRPGFKLVPDPEFMFSAAESRLATHFRRRRVSWSKRLPQALWRGWTTGVSQGNGWRGLDRVALCDLGARHPDRIDAGITGIVQVDDREAAEIRKSGLLRGYVPPEAFNRYKFQIDIDGNSNAWSGLFRKLLTGGVVLKVVSRRGFRQWYYDRLVPWANFVPVAADLSDLLQRLDWLAANDRAARRIGAAGRALALSMTPKAELRRARGAVIEALEPPAEV